jgi:hypothetical protein
LSPSCATLAGASDAVRGAVLSRHVVQLGVNVLGAAEHAAQEWEAAVAAAQRAHKPAALGALVAVEPVRRVRRWLAAPLTANI